MNSLNKFIRKSIYLDSIDKNKMLKRTSNLLRRSRATINTIKLMSECAKTACLGIGHSLNSNSDIYYVDKELI